VRRAEMIERWNLSASPIFTMSFSMSIGFGHCVTNAVLGFIEEKSSDAVTMCESVVIVSTRRILYGLGCLRCLHEQR
jgi:hypothetical protein